MRCALRVLPTADLGPTGLRGLRGLLEAAFTDGYDDASWDHALGGLHVLAGPPEAPAAHAAVVLRRVLHGGLTPDGVVPTPDERGAVHVLPVGVDLDPSAPLVCDWRSGELW